MHIHCMYLDNVQLYRNLMREDRYPMKPLQYDKLSENLLTFFQILRDNGFLIGVREIEESFIALRTINILDEAQFKETLKAILCSSKVERERFEYFFREFLFEQNKDNLLHYLTRKKREKEVEEQKDNDKETYYAPPKNKKKTNKSVFPEMDEVSEFIGLSDNENQEIEVEESAIQQAVNIIQKQPQRRRIFIPDKHFEQMKQAAEILTKKVAFRFSRRKQVVTKGNVIDIRKTMRKSLATGGIPVNPVIIGPRRKSGKFIFFIDGSRSMSMYAKIYLQFAYAMMHYTKDIEIFLFSTKLKRMTEQLRVRGENYFPILSLDENEWEGGTRIGESLATFLSDYGNSLLTRETVCMIASDGLDAGEISFMQSSMQEIKSRTAFVLWFNPLLNMEGYEPVARGMDAALPYIDLFSEAVDAPGIFRETRKLQLKR